jgi:hypothetical protein
MYTNLSYFCDIDDSEEIKINKVTTVAKNIWKFVIEYNLKNTIFDEIKLLEELQIEHTQFSLIFPLVLRWMVQMKQFKVHAFKEYLSFFISAEILSRSDFIKVQSEYLVLLFKNLNPTSTKIDIENYREQIISHLMNEDELFKKIEEEAKVELEQQNNNIQTNRRNAIYNAILRKKIENTTSVENTDVENTNVENTV